MSKMRPTPRSATALICFLEYKRTNDGADTSASKEHTKCTSISDLNHVDLDDNNSALILNPSNNPDELCQQLKSSSNEWIIDDDTLKLLNQDPQQLIQCTKPGDKVIFSLTGEIAFNRTLEIRHDLEFISKPPSTKKEAVEDWNSTASFTCPDSGPFLKIYGAKFSVTGFSIKKCTDSFRLGIVGIFSGSEIVFNNVNISDNKRRAFFVLNEANLTLMHSSFINNHIQLDNGGIVSMSPNVHLKILNSLMLGNTASSGGAIYGTDNIHVEIVYSNFSGNSGWDGGTISLSNNNKITIAESILNGNNASRVGGAIHVSNNNNVTIIDFQLNGSYAVQNGGAIEFNDDNIIVIENTTFHGNKASQNGSAIHNVNRNNITIVMSMFTKNNVGDKGGAIYCENNNTIVLMNATLERNHASSKGGALCFLNKNNFEIHNSTFSGNNATRGGAIHFGDFNTINITYSMLQKNSASHDGGALKVDVANRVSIHSSSFSGNDARFRGTLYINHDTKATIQNCEFTGNKASKGGVIFASTKSSIAIEMCNFSRNKADFGGCLYGSKSLTQVHSSIFVSNNSTKSGGCLYFTSSTIYLDNTTLSLNVAKEESGGVCLTSNSVLTPADTLFALNMANKGGGIAMLSNSKLLCQSCKIFNNMAVQGGGMYIESQRKQVVVAQLQQSSFQNNSASRFGGGMAVKTFGLRDVNCSDTHSLCSRVLLLLTDLLNNTATKYGSIILATKLENILVRCLSFAQTQEELDFWSREKIERELKNKKLQKLDVDKLCPSWIDNWLSNDEHGGQIGTFGQTINLTVHSTDGSQVIRDTSSGFVLENVRSGRPLPDIQVITVDSLNNTPAPTLYERDALILNSTSAFLLQKLVFSFKNDASNISGLVGYVKPGNYKLELHAQETDILNKTYLTIMVRGCLINEEPLFEEKLCQACGETSYNFKISNTDKCTPCPEGASCDGTFIVSMEGYWHQGPCHDKVKECIVEKACKYSNRRENLTSLTHGLKDCNINNETTHKYNKEQCNEGYCGPLCGSCRKSYGSTANFECTKCKRIAISIFSVFGFAIYLLGNCSLSIKGSLPSTSSQAPQGQTTSNSQAQETSTINQDASSFNTLTEQGGDPIVTNEQRKSIDKAKVQILEIWKILLNFFQITSTAATMDIKWASIIQYFFHKLQLFGASTVNAMSSPIDCIVSSSSRSARVIWRVLFSLMVPVIVLAIFVFYWAYRAIAIHRRDGSYFMKRCALSLITITYITYFDLTQLAVRIFNCVAIHEGTFPLFGSTKRVWIGDTSIECYKSTHFTLVGIALVVLIVVSIGFPVLCSLTLFLKKEEVDTPKSWAHDTLGFLCGPYKKRLIYWECVTMIKKALLSIIIVFSYSLGNHAQGLLILLVLVFFLYIHLRCLPYDQEYKDPSLNNCESSSLLTSCLTYTLVQFFNVETIGEIFRDVISIALIAINGGFVLLMLSQIIKGFSFLLKAMLRPMNTQNSENMNLLDFIVAYYKNGKKPAQGA